MTNSLNEILEKITEIINEYENGSFQSKDKVMDMQRKLSALNYHLTSVHVDYRSKHNAVIFRRPDGSSVNSAKNKADVDFPEVDMTRKIMQAVEKVLISMSIELKIMLND